MRIYLIIKICDLQEKVEQVNKYWNEKSVVLYRAYSTFS